MGSTTTKQQKKSGNPRLEICCEGNGNILIAYVDMHALVRPHAFTLAMM